MKMEEKLYLIHQVLHQDIRQTLEEAKETDDALIKEENECLYIIYTNINQ